MTILPEELVKCVEKVLATSSTIPTWDRLAQWHIDKLPEYFQVLMFKPAEVTVTKKWRKREKTDVAQQAN